MWFLGCIQFLRRHAPWKLSNNQCIAKTKFFVDNYLKAQSGDEICDKNTIFQAF